MLRCLARTKLITRKPLFLRSERRYQDDEDDPHMEGRSKLEYLDPASNQIALANALATEGNHEKLQLLLQTMKKPPIEIYNSLIKAYIVSGKYGLIKSVLDELNEDNDAPEQNTETYFPLFFEYLGMGYYGHAHNVFFSAVNAGCISEQVLIRIFDFYIQADSLTEALAFIRCLELTDNFLPELYPVLFDYLSTKGTQGYELLKRYLVYWREYTHAPIPREYENFLFYSSFNATNIFDCYYMLDHFLDKYPTFEADSANMVADHLLYHANKDKKLLITDKIRRLFYRGVARGFRFTDAVVNEILLHFSRNNDIENVFRTFRIAERDVYQIFVENYVTVVKACLQLGSKEALSIVPRLIMESTIPDDYRTSLIQLLLDISNDPHNSLQLHDEFMTLYGYLKLNDVFNFQLNFLVMDYFLSQNDLYHAKDILCFTMERFHKEKLRSNSTAIDFAPNFIDKFEKFTKSPYISVSDNDLTPASLFEFDEEQGKKPQVNKKYIDDNLQKLLYDEISSDEGDFNIKIPKFKNENQKQNSNASAAASFSSFFAANDNNNKQQQKQQNTSTNKPTSNISFDSLDQVFNQFQKKREARSAESLKDFQSRIRFSFRSNDGLPVEPTKPFFSKFPTEGPLGVDVYSKGSALTTNDIVNDTLPKEIHLNDLSRLNVSYDAILTKPKEAFDIQRDFQKERNYLMHEEQNLSGLTGLEIQADMVKENEESNLSTFRDLISGLPSFVALPDLIAARLKTRTIDEHSDFEYNAINEIQARNRVPEEIPTIIDNIWENILTYTVACNNIQDATNLVDEIIAQVPYAEPPSSTLCKRLKLPSEWRSQYD